MSLATLKKRSNTTYRRLSGISSAGGFNVNRTSAGNYGKFFKAATEGGGFSINGSHRNIGYVGQSMAMSQTHQTHHAVFIPGTGKGTGVISVLKGGGGLYGTYYNNQNTFHVSDNNNKSPSTYICCDLPLYSHPSVMNTRGLLTLKKEAITHHNWVQPDNDHSDHTQSNYIENKIKPAVQINILPKCNTGKSCETTTLHKCKYKRINHRIIHPANIAKDLHTMNGAEYINYRKGKYATLPTKQYRQSWPPPISSKSGALTGAGCKKRETYNDFLNDAKYDASMAEILFSCEHPCVINLKN